MKPLQYMVHFKLNNFSKHPRVDEHLTLPVIDLRYKDQGRALIIFVDNCYGELVEEVSIRKAFLSPPHCIIVSGGIDFIPSFQYTL